MRSSSTNYWTRLPDTTYASSHTSHNKGLHKNRNSSNMASANNSLCEADQAYCLSRGRCLGPGEACPQVPYLPNVTQQDCLQLASVQCLTMANSFETAACLRSIPAPYQSAQALTQEMLSDMIYFPEAALQGRTLGRGCLSGPGPTAW